MAPAPAAPSAIPVVDYRLLATDRPAFLRDLRHALADIGFMVLTNVPEFGSEAQRRTFAEVRRFFSAPAEVKATASIALTPHYRGHSPPVQNASQLIETFQYGMEAPARKDPADPWHEVLSGPNTWPDPAALPGFRPAVEDLRERYLRLHHELGCLICEALGADPQCYWDLFDPRDLRLSAFLGHGYSLAHIEKGGIATNARVVSGAEGRARVAAELQKKVSAGAHVDVTPFMTLLTFDRPALQVLSNTGEWLDMPVRDDAVCVNVGSALQHLSGGRLVATVHRVNTTKIPDGETRVSLPFFLLPRFGVPLVPFPGSPAKAGTTYGKEDRAMMAAYNRMSLFPQCTRRWWAAEYQRIKDRVRQAEELENAVARGKVEARGLRASL